MTKAATIIRFNDGNSATFGLVYWGQSFMCYSLEDEEQTKKVYGETRIPPGVYELGIRGHGRLHDKYKDRFSWHRGMIEILDVPGFTDILFHCGNKEDQTDGCILLGNKPNNNSIERAWLGDSAIAYERFYLPVIGELLRGKTILLRIYDNPPLPIILSGGI